MLPAHLIGDSSHLFMETGRRRLISFVEQTISLFTSKWVNGKGELSKASTKNKEHNLPRKLISRTIIHILGKKIL